MRSFLRAARPCDRLGAALLCGLLLGALDPRAAVAQSNTPPTITRQPVGGVAGVGEDFLFTVAASGTDPLAYQWFASGTNLPGQTGTSLLLTNLAILQSGYYGVVVTNVAGRLVSTNVFLTVQTNAPRRLGIARLAEAATEVGVPIVLRANGRENAVSFSLNYDTNAYSNPAFVTGYSNAAVALNLTEPGTVGLSLALETNGTFRPGYRLVGVLRFGLAPGFGPFEGRLAFATNPVPIQASTPEGLSLALPASIQPQHKSSTTNAQLNRQSGLFEQRVVISNPGAAVMTNVNLVVVGMGTDSRSNDVRLQNAQALLVSCPLNDCSVYVQCECECDYWDYYYYGCYNYWGCYEVECIVDITGTYLFTPFVQINVLRPGESRSLTTELYVTDHTTAPRPKYLAYVDNQALLRVPPPNSTVVPVLGTRYLDGVFAVYFATQATNRYFVQYAETVDGLTSIPRTVWPTVIGTGSTVQWLDNGPPKTDSAPTNGTRFYRVLKAP